MPSIKFSAAKIKFLEGVPGKQVDYFDKTLLREVKRLDKANEMGHSLKLQQRFEEHQNLLFVSSPFSGWHRILSEQIDSLHTSCSRYQDRGN